MQDAGLHRDLGHRNLLLLHGDRHHHHLFHVVLLQTGLGEDLGDVRDLLLKLLNMLMRLALLQQHLRDTEIKLLILQ